MQGGACFKPQTRNSDLGLDEALAAYRAALALQPLHTLALYDLARLRWRIGDADFDAELRSALRHDPHAAQPALVQGQLLWRAERDRWVVEDTARVIDICNKVFGGATTLTASGPMPIA